jgi:VCBS repeat-containing protein
MNEPLISTVEFMQKPVHGYISILVDGHWIYEHRYVVQQFIGRELKDGEVIHHIDGNTKNNVIYNLYLFKTQKEHKAFENKVRQFGFTQPIKTQIKNRWKDIK